MARPDPSASRDAPPSIIAGLGCRRGADAAEIIGLVEAALAVVNHPTSALTALASLDRKTAEPGLRAAAAHFEVPLIAFTSAELAASGALGSVTVQALVGIPSVAEAAARCVGSLILPCIKSARVTCALAVAGPDFAQAFAPFSIASTAASRSLTSNAGP